MKPMTLRLLTCSSILCSLLADLLPDPEQQFAAACRILAGRGWHDGIPLAAALVVFFTGHTGSGVHKHVHQQRLLLGIQALEAGEMQQAQMLQQALQVEATVISQSNVVLQRRCMAGVRKGESGMRCGVQDATAHWSWPYRVSYISSSRRVRRVGMVRGGQYLGGEGSFVLHQVRDDFRGGLGRVHGVLAEARPAPVCPTYSFGVDAIFKGLNLSQEEAAGAFLCLDAEKPRECSLRGELAAYSNTARWQAKCLAGVEV